MRTDPTSPGIRDRSQDTGCGSGHRIEPSSSNAQKSTRNGGRAARNSDGAPGVAGAARVVGATVIVIAGAPGAAGAVSAVGVTVTVPGTTVGAAGAVGVASGAARVITPDWVSVGPPGADGVATTVGVIDCTGAESGMKASSAAVCGPALLSVPVTDPVEPAAAWVTLAAVISPLSACSVYPDGGVQVPALNPVANHNTSRSGPAVVTDTAGVVADDADRAARLGVSYGVPVVVAPVMRKARADRVADVVHVKS
jgi:hypothetical protein